MEDTKSKKPAIRLIHNLARSGSTLICKCLGCMSKINLLSEIHPQAVNRFNPVKQGQEWFGLLTPDDMRRLYGKQISFVDSIRLLEQRSRERNEFLVIRDWAHLDFVGVPFLEKPSYRLGLAQALSPAFELIQIATARHPLDLWLSMGRLSILQKAIEQQALTIESFLEGYLQFARQCQQAGFVRYEDFTRSPESEMKQICRQLQLPYDRKFIKRWVRYDTITGDVAGTRGGNRITSLVRRRVDPSLQKRFEQSPLYHEAIALLGYDT